MNVNLILRIQAIAFAVYGIGFFLIPDLVNDGIFGWEDTETIFGRIIGAAFIGLALIEWRLTAEATVDSVLVWAFALIPAIFVVSFIWEQAAGTFTGTDLWYWTNLIVSAAFLVLVGGAALTSRR